MAGAAVNGLTAAIYSVLLGGLWFGWGWLLAVYSVLLGGLWFAYGWTCGTDRARREHLRDLERMARYLERRNAADSATRERQR